MSFQPYPIQLLNDLHHYFPDILYNPTRFRDVQDLLQYIHQVADVNPYTRGLQQYIAHQNHSRGSVASSVHRVPAPAPAPASSARTRPFSFTRNPTIPVSPFVQSTTESTRSTASFSGPQAGENISDWFAAQQPEVSETTYEYTATTNINGNPVTARIRTLPITTAIIEDGDIDAATDQAAVSILNQFLSSNNFQNLQSFLDQSVVVAPTQQQITSASTLESPTEALEDNCAICQDTMEAEQSLRRLNHCHHVFHKMCIDTWFRTNVHCPTCRHDIRTAPASATSSVPPPVPPQHRRTNIRDPPEAD